MNILKKFKAWRDRRFRERIDRVYFRHAGDGMRFIDGLLVLVKDEKTDRHGGLSIGDYLTHHNALSSKNCSALQTDRFYSEPFISATGNPSDNLDCP